MMDAQSRMAQLIPAGGADLRLRIDPDCVDRAMGAGARSHFPQARLPFQNRLMFSCLSKRESNG
jgi:hypothetical protein